MENTYIKSIILQEFDRIKKEEIKEEMYNTYFIFLHILNYIFIVAKEGANVNIPNKKSKYQMILDTFILQFCLGLPCGLKFAIKNAIFSSLVHKFFMYG